MCARVVRYAGNRTLKADADQAGISDGTERASYDEAEQIALSLAEVHGLSVWYEENPQSGRRTLVKSFRGSGEPTGER